MKKKFLSVIITATMICNATPAFANGEVVVDTEVGEVTESLELTEVPEAIESSEVTEVPEVTEDKEDDGHKQSQIEQLQWAIEEMSNAVNILDSGDLTDVENYNALIIWSTAALERVRSLDLSDDTEAMAHIQWIEESGDEIRNATYSIDRLLSAIRNVEIVFSPDRQDTAENMKIVLESLDTVIQEEEEVYSLNQITVQSAKAISSTYWNMLPASPGGELPEIEVNPNKLTEQQSEELNYAIEEMRIAIDLLDNADMTNMDNYNRMIIFATTALDRVRALEITEEYDEWVYVEDIERLGDEVRGATYSINSLLEAIKATVAIFEPGSDADKITSILNILDKTIEDETNNLNQATINAAKEKSAHYWTMIPATPGNPDDNMEVDIPLIPLEPSIPTLPLTPLEPSITVVPMTPLVPSTEVVQMTPLNPSTLVAKTETVLMTKLENATTKKTLPLTGVETIGFGSAMATTLLGGSLIGYKKKLL